MQQGPTHADSSVKRAAIIAVAVICALVLAFMLFQGKRAAEKSLDGTQTSFGRTGWSNRSGDVNSDESAGASHGKETPPPDGASGEP